MAEEYDDIQDFWYSWLFSRLHYKVAGWLCEIPPSRQILDVGCGTGFQSNLVSIFGHNVIGIDIAVGLIQVARHKSPSTYLQQDLFPSPFKFVYEYSKKIRGLALSQPRGVGRIDYCPASATEIPLASSTVDVVLCCGSTLNFVDDYMAALREMHRVLRPHGHLWLEVENRYNLDLLWALLENILHLPFGFDQDWRHSVANITAPRDQHVLIDYPFETRDRVVNMPLRLFAVSGFKRELQTLGFRVQELSGIHNVTNLLPSTLLHHPNPGRLLKRLSTSLGVLESLVSVLPPIRALGCSTVYQIAKL